MTPTWYNTPERIDCLVEAATSWLHTPFRENSTAKGPRGGVSCHNLVAEIYRESGFFPEGFRAPRGYVHQLTSTAPQTILDWIDAQMPDRFAPAPADFAALLAGDLVAMHHDDDVLRHIGIVLPGRNFIHVLKMFGTRISHMHDATYATRIAQIRRPQP